MGLHHRDAEINLRGLAGPATLQHHSVELYFRTADVIVNTYLVSAG